ncbi:MULTISPECIES: helix-turn-helix domain-containing protein [Burkholderia]|uniref:helix-turn-helix domain-containing protein n=1 Tax=Burkholderia TaxID=32008 RepID=UPI00158143AD|nr:MULTISPECIES: helix-turn-helix transcriptional regulator [Burkholderia]
MPKQRPVTPENVRLGSKIRNLRKRLDKTLEDVATASGLSKGYMSQVERGYASPSLSSLTRIATALGVAVDYFLTRWVTIYQFRMPNQERFSARRNHPTAFPV